MGISHRLSVNLEDCDEQTAQDLWNAFQQSVDAVQREGKCSGGQVHFGAAPFADLKSVPSALSSLSFNDIIELEPDEL